MGTSRYTRFNCFLFRSLPWIGDICPRCSLQWPVSPLFLSCFDRTAMRRAGAELDLTRSLYKHQSSSEDVNPRLRARGRKIEETRSVAAFFKTRNGNSSRQHILIITLPMHALLLCTFSLCVNGVLWRSSACSNDVRAQTGWAGVLLCMPSVCFHAGQSVTELMHWRNGTESTCVYYAVLSFQ